jgi:hypothetical protein
MCYRAVGNSQGGSREAREAGRGPRKGERKDGREHRLNTVRPLGAGTPSGQVVTYPLVRKGQTMVAVREITWEEPGERRS